MPSDVYRTLSVPAESRLKIERSQFLGMAFPLSHEETFFQSLHRIEKQYFDATHHCWAFRLFEDGKTRERSSDAGEPSGTAGKPILAAIAGADLFDAGVVVVRWYGGVKLGTGGLARAYRDTAAATLRDADIVDRYLYERFIVTVPFDMLNLAYRLIDQPHVILISEQFEKQNFFMFDVRRSRSEAFAAALTEKRLVFRRD